MLSRTADNLYWLSRYTERADFNARIIDATLRFASLPSSYGGERNEWESALAVAGDVTAFKRLYDGVNQDTVCDFLALSPHNSSSIRRCIEVAREAKRQFEAGLPMAAIRDTIEIKIGQGQQGTPTPRPAG